jgi:hypothetical protein
MTGGAVRGFMIWLVLEYPCIQVVIDDLHDERRQIVIIGSKLTEIIWVKVSNGKVLNLPHALIDFNAALQRK